MHEDAPSRIGVIATAAGGLVTQLQGALASSAPFVAESGAVASQIRAEAQLGALFEDDESLASFFGIAQRTAAQMEKIAQESAALNQRLVTLSKQLQRDVTALQGRVTEIQEAV